MKATCPNHHLILTSGRSGSNYLANTLNQHPNIVNYGETISNFSLPYKLYRLSNKLHTWNITAYLDHIYQSRSFFYAAQLYSLAAHLRKRIPPNFKRYGHIKSVGIKDFSLYFYLRNITEYPVKHRNLRIIYLYRENILRRYLSLLFLNRTKVASTTKAVAVSALTVDVNQMLNDLNILEQQVEDEQRLVKRLQKHALLNIRYEDYFAGEQALATHNRRIFKFLDVTPLAVRSDQKKILPQKMRDLVANYHEFKACLANTPYQPFLD